MAAERQNLLARREILSAYTEVLDRIDELVTVCSAVSGGTAELRGAIQRAFGLSEMAADAVLSMQVQRFTPMERQKVHDELACLDLELDRIDHA